MRSNLLSALLLTFLFLTLGFAAYWYGANQTFSPLPQLRLTENEVRQLIVTEFQREEERSFLITGVVHLVAEITEENTKYLFPDFFDETISLGTTRSKVRLPGRVSYGIDLARIDPDLISFRDDSVFVFSLRSIDIHSVESNLEEMEIQTEVGWARLHSRSGRSVERRAMIEANKMLRVEAEKHIQVEVQPLLNTENALRQFLTPVLRQAGVSNPLVKCNLVPAVSPSSAPN